MRPDGRSNHELRPLSIEPDYLKDPEGSVLIRAGATWVVCTASIEDRVPPFLRDAGTGWVTAEYAMLPRSTTTRSSRAPGGRSKEIERLIGRALRASVDLARLGPRTITVDCDVIQADGGTRTAAITGGFVALALACRRLAARLGVATAISEEVAAVSVGIVDGEARLDLPFVEDARADVDMNVVLTGSGRFVEVQGTAEHQSFDRAQLDAMCDLAAAGCRQLVEAQRRALESARR